MKAKSQSAKTSNSSGTSQLTSNDANGDASVDCPREQIIAEAAYFHAERRGFAPGYEVADWLQAEADLGHLF